ncbi:hypothetical protein NMY22_g1586 [Coprinellus aureogranulatus]|nr:hypothetical protein NMY22_g1586 [Coprinellus aureogranulatus]
MHVFDQGLSNSLSRPLAVRTLTSLRFAACPATKPAMPRIGASFTKPPASSDPLVIPPQHPNILKRNQVRAVVLGCDLPPPFSMLLTRHVTKNGKVDLYQHGAPLAQRRSSDAKRPCSTCIRSHAHALAHAPPGTNLPQAPECTFDESEAVGPLVAPPSDHYRPMLEPPVTVSEAPKNKYERLETRIAQLEREVREKDLALMHAAQHKISTNGILQTRAFNESPDFHEFIPDVGTSYCGPTSDHPSGLLSVSPTLSQSHTTPRSPDYGLDLPLVYPSWPAQLPSPDLLKHLIEVFFIFHPHASRLFHVPSFMSSISLPPTHPRFPAIPILHAICAVGSLYTAAVTSPPLPDFDEVPPGKSIQHVKEITPRSNYHCPSPDEIFLERLRAKEQRPDSFAERHAKLARESADHLNTLVPLGLNVCPPFLSMAKSERPQSILPPSRNAIEDETRRNAFWLAYAIEREHGYGNAWAHALDDADISQLLPVRGDQFQQGTYIAPLERQWAHGRDVLSNHPDLTTDSFVLYIKGTILLSKTKAFNSRFRARHFAGDSSVASPRQDQYPNDPIDPRSSPAFMELDNCLSSFKRDHFPSHLRTPIVDNVVDNHLYTAFLLPLVSTIMLHDPHAEVQRSGCISALKILTAARAILDLIYDVTNTSFDITLLDTFCSVCWFSSGRVLVRFLQASLEARNTEQINTLQSEINFIYSCIAKVGQRVPLGYRLAKMLEDLMKKRCGPLMNSNTAPTDISFLGFSQTTHGTVQLYEEVDEAIGGDFTGLRHSLHDLGLPAA